MFGKKNTHRFIAICVLVSVLFTGQASPLREKDSTRFLRDTLIIYKKLKKLASKNKWTLQLYNSIFVDPESREYTPNPVNPPPTHEEKMINPYMKYTGLIIRDVIVGVKDPFGYSIYDTARHKINYVQRLGNYYHLTTRHRIIRNMLLFKRDDHLDPLALSESERIIRTAAYINDARIMVMPVGHDSVDVIVLAQDRWEVTVPAAVTTNELDLKFHDKNILGQGQQFNQHFQYTRSRQYYNFDGSYYVANLGHSFISSNTYYQVNKDLTQAGISFDRPFYSPLAKWAGGASLGKVWAYYDDNDTIEHLVQRKHLDNYDYDVWAAKNFKFNKGRTMIDKSTNITLGWRYYGTAYEHRPPATQDTSHFYSNRSMYLGSVGVALQQYYKDSYIYRFGANEDVAAGIIFQWFYGFKMQEGAESRFYTGFDIGRAKHFRHLGYLSLSFSYGILFNTHVANNTTFLTRVYYFSNLHRSGKWFFRQFVTYKYIDGQNKPSYEYITLHPEELYGLNSGDLKGKSKMLLNLQTVAYAPYNLLGFRFAPVLMAGFGITAGNTPELFNEQVYQGYAVGLLVRNENLLSSTFQVTFGFYPVLPDGRRNVFMYNPVTSFTIKVRDFSIAKPNVISYD